MNRHPDNLATECIAAQFAKMPMAETFRHGNNSAKVALIIKYWQAQYNRIQEFQKEVAALKSAAISIVERLHAIDMPPNVTTLESLVAELILRYNGQHSIIAKYQKDMRTRDEIIDRQYKDLQSASASLVELSAMHQKLKKELEEQTIQLADLQAKIAENKNIRQPITDKEATDLATAYMKENDRAPEVTTDRRWAWDGRKTTTTRAKEELPFDIWSAMMRYPNVVGLRIKDDEFCFIKFQTEAEAICALGHALHDRRWQASLAQVLDYPYLSVRIWMDHHDREAEKVGGMYYWDNPNCTNTKGKEALPLELWEVINNGRARGPGNNTKSFPTYDGAIEALERALIQLKVIPPKS